MSYRDFVVSNYTLDDFVSYIKVTTKANTEIWIVTDQLKTDDTLIKIKRNWNPQYGTCYTLKFEETLRSQEISSIEIAKR